MNKLEKFLLQLTIFLIPTNLAYHWYLPEAYLHGHLIDYLLPKIYLSDMPILGLILILLFKYYNFKYVINNIHRIFSGRNLSIIALFTYLTIIAIGSPFPLSSLWFVGKWLEFVLFGVYLMKCAHNPGFRRLLISPLLAALCFQSLIALYQYIHQSSVLGYSFFGEPDLQSVGLASVDWGGTLKIAPYGTTAHPNVLAGFLSVSIIILLLCIQKLPISLVKRLALIMVISLSTLVILVTQSQTAIISFLIGAAFLILSSSISKHHLHVLIRAIAISTPLFAMLFILFSHQHPLLSDNRSFFVRYELIQSAFRLILQAPLTGVGPNLFTTALPAISLAGQKTVFLQPVHHLLLLIVAETGIVGSLLLIIALKPALKRLKSASPPSLIPLLMIVLIGCLDHYPLTLQSGQLLLVLSFCFPLIQSSIRS